MHLRAVHCILYYCQIWDAIVIPVDAPSVLQHNACSLLCCPCNEQVKDGNLVVGEDSTIFEGLAREACITRSSPEALILGFELTDGSKSMADIILGKVTTFHDFQRACDHVHASITLRATKGYKNVIRQSESSSGFYCYAKGCTTGGCISQAVRHALLQDKPSSAWHLYNRPNHGHAHSVVARKCMGWKVSCVGSQQLAYFTLWHLHRHFDRCYTSMFRRCRCRVIILCVFCSCDVGGFWPVRGASCGG